MTNYRKVANGLLSKKLSEEELRKVISELYEQVGTFDSLVWKVVSPTRENWAEFYFGSSENIVDPNPELYSVNYPCLNALTGIFCFSIRQIWRIIMKTNPSQCPHGHFLFFNQDTQ